MPLSYKTPGVYKEEVFLKPEAQLPTGVPGFAGFVVAGNESVRAPYSPVALQRKEEFGDQFGSQPGSYLADVVNGFFDNGGIRCYVVGAEWQSDPEKSETALLKAIEALAPLNDLDLVAVPDVMTLWWPNNPLDWGTKTRVQGKVLEHCARHHGRLSILDALPGDPLKDPTQNLLDQRNSLMIGQTEPVNGTLYYPWLKTGSNRLVPPCGHIAGIFARTDARVGVFKAPANEELLGVLDLEYPIDNLIQDVLNPEGVNCLRAFPGRGIRVWGARTLSRDPDWRYVNVRRLFLTLGRWIDMNMSWATWEPNTPRLWVRIQRELNAYLTQLWREGAVKGVTSDQAFYVKCDAETNPPEDRTAGKVITEIGLSPEVPAEFVVVRIIHRAATTEVS